MVASPRLAYLVTEDWYFVLHRLPMARAARQAGFDVHVMTRVDRYGTAITAEGFQLHSVHWRRGSLNPWHLLRTVWDVRRLYRTLKPDVAHHVAVLPTVAGSVAALGLPVVCLNAIAGLGSTFTGDTIKIRLTRIMVTTALRWLLRRERSAVLVENRDNGKSIERLGVNPEWITLIAGSGIDITRLRPLPDPAGIVTVAFVGRLLEDKGLRTLLAAHERLQRRGSKVRLIIAGLPDPSNPSSIPLAEIEAWKNKPDLAYLGFVEDVTIIWAQAHIAVLPSRAEGAPMSLLEAAACGRPLIATDVPGCRDVVRNAVNGFLVPLDDTDKLADAIERLANDPGLRRSFGQRGREMVEREFSSEHVGREIVGLYQKLLRTMADR